MGRGHGGRVVILLPPTSEIGVRNPARPQVGKLVVVCHWSAVYNTAIQNLDQVYLLVSSAHKTTRHDMTYTCVDLFIYLGFYIAFNTVQVISRRVVGRAEETSTYSSLGFGTVNCRPTASNYQLSHLRP